MFALAGQYGDDGRQEWHPNGTKVPNENHHFRRCSVKIWEDRVGGVGVRSCRVVVWSQAVRAKEKWGPGDQHNTHDHEDSYQGSGKIKAF